MNQPLVMNSSSTNPTQLCSLAPMMKEWIIKGEYIDFSILSPKAMFSGNSEPDHPGNGDLSVHSTAKSRILILDGSLEHLPCDTC